MERNFVFLHDHDGYHHRGHNKTKLLVHLIFVTKYRKPLLSGNIDNDIKQSIFEAAKENHWYIQKWKQIQITSISCCNILRTTAFGISFLY